MEHSLWELIHELVKGHEDMPAVLYREGERTVRVSYGALLQDLETAARLAAALPESRIGIWGGSSYAWIAAAYGCLLAGKHVILFDESIGEEDFRRLAEYADAEAFAVSPELAAEAGELFPDRAVYGFDRFAEPAGRGETRWVPGESEKSIVIFTSGTSAGAKGVVIPAATLAEHLRLFKHALPGEAEEVYFSPIPFFHIFGFLMVIEVFNRHGVFCIGSGGRELKNDLWAYDAHNVSLVPSMIKFALDTCGFPPRTRKVITGGSACPGEYQDMLRRRGIDLFAMYGMSEVIGLAAISEAGGELLRYRPVDGVDVRLSEEGEVLLTLPCHFEGYYKKDEETRQVLRGDTVMTGDLGQMDEAGYLRIVGRMGEMIVLRNGEKLNAADLDRELSALPGVREAAVFGYDGYPVLAYTPGEDFDEERFQAALAQYNRGRPVDRKIVRVWDHRDSLPRTAMSKIKRNGLAEEYRKLSRGGD